MAPFLDNLIGDLTQLGFADPDEPSSGADTVDVIAEHWDTLLDCREEMNRLRRHNAQMGEALHALAMAATSALTLAKGE